MRLAVLIALAGAGCGRGDPASVDGASDGAVADRSVPLDGASPGDGARSCFATCEGACADGFDCVVLPPFIATFPATCLQTCTVSNECGDGGHCIKPFEALGGRRYCVSEGVPAACFPGSVCDSFVLAACMGEVAIAPYSQKSGATCGPEFIDCADAG
jgi:hypothetical protein